MAGLQFPAESQTGAAGLPTLGTMFGDLVVGQRRDLSTANFVYGLPSQTFLRVEEWTAAGGAGVPNADERVVGNTSGAVGVALTVGATTQIKVLQGWFTDGETITFIGVTATYSGATRVITKNALINGTTTITDSVARVQAGTAPTSGIALLSKHLANYSAGHALGGFWTAAFDPDGSADSILFSGLCTADAQQGLGIGFENGVYGFCVRRAGVITFTPQSEWTIDKFDGTGPSGLTIDPAALNIYGIQIGYLGVYGAWLYIMGEDMVAHPAHRFTLVNQGLDCHITDPHLALGVRVIKGSGAERPSVYTASWNGYTVGPMAGNDAPQRVGDYAMTATQSITTAETHLFTITNNQTFAGVSNNTPVKLKSISYGGINFGANEVMVIRIRRNAPVRRVAAVTGGLNQTAIDALNSCCSVATTAGGGAVDTGQNGGDILASFVLTSTLSANPGTDLTDRDFFIVPGESVTVTAQMNTGTADILVTLGWEEYH